MRQETKLVFSFNLLMFLAVGIVLALVITYPSKEDSPEKPLTESEKRLTESEKPQQAGHPAPSKSEAGTAESNVEVPKETAIKLARAWNQGRSREIADLFAADGELTIPNGAKIRSRSEIEKTIAEKRNGVLSETTLNNTVDEVSQIDDHTAVVKGRYQLDGIKVLGFSTGAKGTFVLRQSKREGKWLISRAEVKTGDG